VIYGLKSSKGQRLYRKKDLDAIFLIKKLLYEKKFTSDGARKYLSTQKQFLTRLSKELNDIVELLDKDETS